jgi:type IV secretory pathway VirB3-like protein
VNDDEVILWEPVATAAARPAIVRGWSVPLYTIPVVVGVPIVLTIMTYNGFWLALVLVLARLVRTLFGDDQNRARVHWLSFVSGQMFADRTWGGDSRDPLSG